MKSDASTIEARRNRLIELLAEGKTEAQAAKILRAEGHPASHDTVERDVRKLAPAWRVANEAAFDEYRQNQLTLLSELREQLENPALKVDRRIELSLSILDREIKLTGTEAPSKSITAHVATNTAIQYRFLEHAHGLSEQQLDDVFALMDSLQRRKVTIADCFPDQTPQLEAAVADPEEATAIEEEL